ncbi:hypothetical protein HRI_001235000 [Hibiscus trionum]|nr:hypothetical protein HRI_001235000 [Hibiscus trionum]
MIGTMSGFVAELNLGAIFAKWLSIQATVLRTISVEKKASIVNEVNKNVCLVIMSAKVKSVIYQQLGGGEWRTHGSGKRVGIGWWAKK